MISSLLVIAAAVTVNFDKEIGKVRPELHSSGFGPQICSCPQASIDAIKSMGFKASRTHDWALINSGQRVCDYFHMFPLMHLDAKNPENYVFGPTDYLLKRTREEMGHDIFFRLGTSIEHSGSKVHFNARIPEDFDKVAEIFAGTIRHYNKGWGNGHEWGIKYWEIWNEPDGNNTMWCLPDGDLGVGETEDERKADMAARTLKRRDLFARFFVTCLKRLKGEFPDIKVGGPALCREILRLSKAAGMHTAIETSGYAPLKVVESMEPFVDLWLYDIKLLDPANCLKHTGRPLAPVVDNIRHLSAARRRIVMRCPMIPGINDDEAELKARGALADELDAVQAIDVLPYVPYGVDKAQRRGLKVYEASLPPPGYGSSIVNRLSRLTRKPVRLS